MTLDALTLVVVLGFLLQLAGVTFLGLLVYRQHREFSAGEAAIFLDQRKLRDLYAELATALRAEGR
jgi:hypothetical protein